MQLFCATLVKHDRSSNVKKHRDTAKHQQSISLKVSQQFLISSYNLPRKDFVTKVTSAFLSADIPLQKLHHPGSQGLLEYMGQRSLSGAGCRKLVTLLAKKKLARVAELLDGKQLFMIVDEAEVAGRKYINTLVGDITCTLHCH